MVRLLFRQVSARWGKSPAAMKLRPPSRPPPCPISGPQRRFIAEDGNKMVEAEIIELSSGYSGEIEMGVRVTFPEDDPSMVCVCPT